MKSASEVRDWYNTFSDVQLDTGVNLRHYHIFRKLVKSGLKRNQKVLEVGCGIGTLTQLLTRYVNKGFILATDISDGSIDLARRRIPGENVEFVVTDMQDFSWPDKFDLIILPDVLEHIPMSQHDNLFKVFSQLTHDKSRILIHLPHPKRIEFLHEHDPGALQVIDQAVHADFLCKAAYASDFILESYDSYGLFDQEHDYAMILMKPNRSVTYRPLSRNVIIARKFFARLYYFMKTL